MNCRTAAESLARLARNCAGGRRPRPAARQQITVVGDGGELVHVVGDHDAGDPECLVHVLDEAQDDTERDRIEPDERLIVDQQLRVHDNGPRQRHAPRHATRELPRHEPGGAAQPTACSLVSTSL